MRELKPAELWAGMQNRDPLRRDYLSLIQGKVKRALEGQMASHTPDSEAITRLSEVTAGLKQMEKELVGSPSVGEVFTFLDEKAPFSLQEGFDNAGFLVGRKDAAVSKILVALDITEQVAAEAAEQGAHLIVSHHPVIFEGIRSVTDQTGNGRILLFLIEHGIAAICAHTNLDAVDGGVNDILARRLGLTGVGQLKQSGVDRQGRPYGIGRVGYVPEQPLYGFAMAVKRLLGANGLRLVDGGKPVHKVAVGGGACAGMMGDALIQGCDTFITSDVKYNSFLDARTSGMNLIDAGHFPTEDVIVPVLRDWLAERFPSVSVLISQRHHEVFSCL